MDSFKGSLSAYEAGESVRAGVEQAFDLLLTPDERDSSRCVNLPLADGGEGLIDCLRPLLTAQGFTAVQLPVYCAKLNQPQVTATMLVRGQECYIESAQALGLPLIAPEQRDIMTASSFGLGQMIAKALELGCNDLKIGLGGSATNDLGLGMAQALGVTFAGVPADTDIDGHTTITEVERWSQFTSLDDSALKQRLTALGCKVTILSDVNNPLLGPQGATAVFSAQKGADAQQQERLERALSAGATLLTQHYGHDFTNAAGAGAAGGLGAALMYFMDAQVESGINAVLEQLNFDHELKDADLVITGEGRFDTQSLHGKGPVGIASRATAQNVPVWVLCGSKDARVTPAQLHELGISSCLSITANSGPISLPDSMAQTHSLLQGTASNLMLGALSLRAKPSQAPSTTLRSYRCCAVSYHRYH